MAREVRFERRTVRPPRSVQMPQKEYYVKWTGSLNRPSIGS